MCHVLTPEGKRASNGKCCNGCRKHVARTAVSIDGALEGQGDETPEARLGRHAEALADAALHGVVVLGLVVKVPAGRRVGHLVGVLGAEAQLGHLAALRGAEREADDGGGDGAEYETRWCCG